ncbi:hypothetical protein KP509_14G065400 [Ceratopteris richardii]|uniref:4a-hydroxytetrahydrobiopterin dehydratase n=1 Tax=Ceratopteris richardii TaxID=49495 RepID=A0A8T2TDR4_CERRI|nr:hypothetical protein KP509_14G065400 [Ceratopteris richardii]KAH7415905.1 hypothetical protein KP509_14G065400 [Ceratopteris richardii]
MAATAQTVCAQQGLTFTKAFGEEASCSWKIRSLKWVRESKKISCGSLRSVNRRGLVVAQVGPPAPELFGRDPFAEEIASNFADKVQGLADTEHIILVPKTNALSLSRRSCINPLPHGTIPFSSKEAKDLLRKVVGWRLVEEQTTLKLECEWKLKDHAAGLELMNRISKVTEAEKKHIDLDLDDQTHILKARIWTESIGGLCVNDYIIAAKIDELDTSDLIKKMRVWA